MLCPLKLNRSKSNATETTQSQGHQKEVIHLVPLFGGVSLLNLRKGMKYIIPLLLTALLYSSNTSSEAGMIPFDSPVGEIGGRGHWYALRTMKGDLFWDDPPVFTDIKEDEDGYYSIAGEPPIAVVIVLHPDFFRDREPWRRAIDWVRQAEQMYRNSGVALRFVINHIDTWNEMPDTKLAALQAMDATKYSEYGPDLLIMLLPHYYAD